MKKILSFLLAALMMTALLNFRNKAVKAGKPTEDINELILRIMK